MNLDLEKLRKLAKPRNEAGERRARFRMESYGWRRMSQDVALAIFHHLREKGISQKKFAEMMGVSAPYVAKLLKGTENLTLETIYKIEEALETEIVHINHPYETVITVPFHSLSESKMAIKSHKYSGNTTCDNYANVFTTMNYAV